LIITEQNRVNGHRLTERTNPVQTGHYDERTWYHYQSQKLKMCKYVCLFQDMT